MSTVLLMTDSWQPTVLRLVPFSQNNAKYTDKKRLRGGESGSKSFPVLAVTRTGKSERNMKVNSPDTRQTPSRSAASSRSDVLTEPDTAKSEISIATAKESVYTTFTYATDCLEEAKTPIHGHGKRYQKKKVPKSHVDLNEAIKFPVQDLNEQVSSTSSFKSVDSVNESKSDGINKLDNTRTKLPKPSLCQSTDIKTHAPVNGVRRSVPLTPGELELKRIRESYMFDQSQKGKKYKLNINQLPRSTTPINDHDPDKLNMKQVIAFLQTKANRDSRNKNQTPSTKSPRKTTLHSNQCAKVSLRSTDPKDSIPARSHTSTAHNERNTPGRESVLSTKSTPNFSSEKRAERYPNSLSSRSHIERSRLKRTEHGKHRKPMKEFKLYRFLTVAPDGPYQGLATTVTETLQNQGPEIMKTGNSHNNNKLFVQREKRDFLKKSYRSTTTANLLHRRAARKSIVTPTNSDEKENEDNQDAIRLPTVTHDHESLEESIAPTIIDDDDNASDTCSTTSATCNSVKNVSYLEEHGMLPKKGKTLTFQEDVERDFKHEESSDLKFDTVHTDSRPVQINSLMTRMYTTPDFPRVNIGTTGISSQTSGPRQIQINMPKENRNGYSQEIVKLTLRHEKNATRVTSYMSDMQNLSWPKHSGPDMNGSQGAGYMNQIRPMDSTLNYNSHKELYDSTKQTASAVSNNHFIKVRQKLKSNMYENE